MIRIAAVDDEKHVLERFERMVSEVKELELCGLFSTGKQLLDYILNAPILLVGSTEADQAKVIEYIDNSMDKAGEVYILGGTGVVGADMEAKIVAKGFNHITRLAGKDRYETALKTLSA